VEYSTSKQALDAIDGLSGKVFDGKRLKISYARNHSPEIKNANMYVSGLHPAVDRDGLFKLFQPFGTIITYNILRGLKWLIIVDILI
jgi:RNA recognition motif-containing protein